MRLKSSLISLKSKLSRSCNRLISFFHARFGNVNTTQSSSSSSLLSCLCFLNTNKDQRMSQIRPRSSPSSLIDGVKLLHSRKMFPLAATQRNKKARKSQRYMSKENGVKEACRSFENYMIHMVVEDGKIDDLMDMEEFLYYWNNLNNPIFLDLVTRFYGELCTDLFPVDDDCVKN
ncbi:PREDICTED: transcription repressor OFP17-like [Camelina sativa]|uniref:Transcription repressor OFP17-like n=1 Tax=Camelina sativa TaxID=90675 RepID=A0ABM0XJE4_CAMSA|nr:PREDICTED: transcription repressor OFP17-like [Camelina sativa]